MTTQRTLRLAAAALTTVLAACLAAPASASSPEATPAGPWHRYHQPDFTVKPGQACDFGVRVHVLYDREFYRVVSRFRGGAPRAELFRGPLIVQYIDQASGSKVIRDESGVGVEKFDAAGDFVSIKAVNGHYGATLTPGSTPSRGMYYVGGQGSAVFSNGDGTYRLHLGPNGKATNVCPILARG